MKFYDISVTEVDPDNSDWEPDVPTGKVYSSADMNWMGALMWLWGLGSGLLLGMVWL